MFKAKPCFVPLLILFAFQLITATPASATIALGQVDDFETDNNGWGPSRVSSVEADAGPNGVGDNALLVNNGLVRHGSEDIPTEPSLTDQWNGNWTAEKVTQIRMDVRNPGNSVLTLRLGMAGLGGPNSFYTGDTYLSANTIIVPADDTWHTILFDVTASAWADYAGSAAGDDPATALENVSHLRVINNTEVSFRGESGTVMYLDNITAVPEPGSIALAVGAMLISFQLRRVG